MGEGGKGKREDREEGREGGKTEGDGGRGGRGRGRKGRGEGGGVKDAFPGRKPNEWPEAEKTPLTVGLWRCEQGHPGHCTGIRFLRTRGHRK